MALNLIIFLFWCFILYVSGKWLVKSLARIADFLNWREFTVSFVILAGAASLPNLFVGIASALQKIPQLSFGEISSGNIIDLTLAVGLATLFSRKGIPTKSRTIQNTSVFIIISCFLPFLLVLDGNLSRVDGLVLIALFFVYLFWLFKKRERFTRSYDSEMAFQNLSVKKEFKLFFKSIGGTILGVVLLLFASQQIVNSAVFFANGLALPIFLVGIFIVGLGNALPETYFAIASARRGETWMILGDLMGSVNITSTLVLGIVALIYPVQITNFSPFAIARIFIILSVLSFFLFIRTGSQITKREAVFLIMVYVLFILSEIVKM